MMTQKTGILLLNTGTPEKADRKHVSKYLRQFLMDPRVIDLPWYIRFPLIHGFIIPTRTKTSTESYQKIWTNAGSPLLVNCLALKEKLAEKLGTHYTVELGMRYGQPDISSAIEKLKQANCDKWIIIPLFPQYASASTGSAIETVLKNITKNWNLSSLDIKATFYNYPGFIDAYARNIQNTGNITGKSPDFFLFSYHGLPWRHIEKSGCKNNCHDKICPTMSPDNTFCYRAQCYTTSQLLAEKLNLHKDQYDTAFQSRLGKTPWITPYSDHYLSVLIKKGIKNLFVACPSFTSDCLETLEEVGMRLKEQWHELGGQHFTLSPCLNADEYWVEKLTQFILTPKATN